jgi:dinuclear metal center YbgI/SA1388 family protein
MRACFIFKIYTKTRICAIPLHEKDKTYNIKLMTIETFDQWVQKVMLFTLPDMAINGLQVGNKQKEIKHIAFALDACATSFNLAQKADLLFVHHGLFWSKGAVTELMYTRIKQLVEQDTALYAVHLPLDHAPEFGNNAAVVARAELTDCIRFADIGYVGNLSEKTDAYSLATKIFGHHPATIWTNSSQPLRRAAVVVGGAARTYYVEQAIAAGADVMITGEHNLQIFHQCAEAGLSWIAGGHYRSELYGLERFKLLVETEFPLIRTTFIDLPTGC